MVDMKHRKITLGLLIFLTVMYLPGYSFAQDGFQDMLKVGGSLRLRHEYWRNIFDLENRTRGDRNFFRFKASLWTKLNLAENLALFAKLTDESRAYMYYHISRKGKTTHYFDDSEVVFDNLYIDIKDLLGAPIDFRLGRQDFLGQYGEGFLIMDGTPLDGSRTFYFNALKATWRVDDKNTVDFVYIDNPTKGRGEGSGLGLSVTQSIIEMHKAIINVESEPGKGAKVIVAMRPL